MQKFGISQPLRRDEDHRFLTGAGAYLDDVAPRAGLVAHFFRAPVAHARIAALDLDAARAAPGVHAVLGAADLDALGMRNHIDAVLVKNRDGSDGAAPQRPALAVDRVRFLGEPVALVVAETRAAARDAAELIEVEFEDLPVKLDLAPGGSQLHPEAPDNIAYDWAIGDEHKLREIFETAAHRVVLDVADNRVFATSMEPRGCFADWREGRLHFGFSGQGVWGMKAALSGAFGLEPDAVHVTIPDVGGGFGMKALPYPEYFAVAAAARVTGRPVRWVPDRGESMLGDNAGRDLVSRAEAAFDADLRLIGYRVETLSNLGAYNSAFAQMIQSQLASRVLTGAYDVQDVFFNARGIYTNTTQVDAYRGAGRPEAIYVLERLMDRAARELGVSPAELRRRNFIPPSAFPYRSSTGETYDVGEFARVLARAETEADVAGFPARRAEAARRGRLRGLGLAYYVEAILGMPDENVRVEFDAEGAARVYVGTQSNGQGHETVYRQIVHEFTGLAPETVTIVQGDSDLIAKGGGTGGSRSVTLQGTAIHRAAEVIVEKFTPFVAAHLDLPEAEIGFAEGAFRAAGSNRFVTLAEAAAAAHAAGRSDLLVTDVEITLPERSFPNGAHFAEVEIDPETGTVEVVRYTVADDFGVLMNPMLAEGQVHGGVVQGIGQALMESVSHDEAGQLLSGSFMDYAMPRAADVPFVAFHSEPVPSTANPLGMKGCGEAGTVGALGAVANAVQDALWAEGVRQVDMPCTPARVWSWLRAARRAAA